MPTIKLAYLAFLPMLGFIVFIHELGHHLVAKACGVRVLIFSIGFGKKLWSFTWGGTEYRVSLLPFGGYVSMAGENPLEPSTGDQGEFTAHPRWQRILIAMAGPAMNIVRALALLTGLYMVHYEYDPAMEKPALVNEVDPKGPGAKAGTQPGDLIVQGGNLLNPTWKEFYERVILP